MSKGVLILGATSPIARSVSEQLAAQGYSLFLGARNLEEITRLKSDLALRFPVEVHSGFFEAEDIAGHARFLSAAMDAMGGLEGVVVAFGYMGDENMWPYDSEEVARIINRNMTGACSILTQCASVLEKKGKGFVVAISSVAGDRGRQGNYVYGAAKGGLNLFLQGLRGRLHERGVSVLTVKPGFVDTRMTFGKPGTFLVASPQYVGKKIITAVRRGRNEIYVPWFWRWIMGIIKWIPEIVFKRLKF